MEGKVDIKFFLHTLEKETRDLLEDFPGLRNEARAFDAWALFQISGARDDEVVDSVVDGPDDKGIDAIYISDEGRKLVVMQATRPENTERNLPAVDIVKTLNGVDWLLNGDLSHAANRAFRARAEAFREAFVATFPPVEVLFVCTCKGPAGDGQAEIAKFLSTWNTLQETFSVEVYDLDRIFEVYTRNLTRTSPNLIRLDFIDEPYEHAVGDTTSVVGTIKGSVLADLFSRYGNAIFEANIRSYLGNVKINKSIINTAKDQEEARNFWFYNNGVTFVCDAVRWRSARDISRIELTNAQIVNGCQTVNCLYLAASTGQLENDVEVLVRILEKPDPEFMRRVTLHTNSQNAVRAADLVGTDPIQLQLKKDFERLGYYYETRRGEFAAQYGDRSERIQAFGDDYKFKIIKLHYAAQAYAAFYVQIPVIAKKNTTYLFLSKADGGRYEDIFNSETTARKLLGAVHLMSRITECRREAVAQPSPAPSELQLKWIPHGDHFILGLFYHRFFDADRATDDQYIKQYFDYVWENFDRLYEDTVSTISGYIMESSQSPTYDHVKYFKSETGYIELCNLFDHSARYSP